MRLQVVKTGGTPKVPDCFQRTPKKLCIPEKAEILAVNVDSKGVFSHFILSLFCSVFTEVVVCSSCVLLFSVRCVFIHFFLNSVF